MIEFGGKGFVSGQSGFFLDFLRLTEQVGCGYKIGSLCCDQSEFVWLVIWRNIKKTKIG
ncbi:MAG: hypothetical protein A4E53_02575 [Pelotomaculum sp. PtaB.Bin104]|nr:MAG: hypothetical protein A4E53_02575 [Pelotomaculum sp. PtaB.Bin104]